MEFSKPECQCAKNEFLQIEYEKVLKYCQELQRELHNKNSEITSMRLALSYTDSFSMRKETEIREENERLKMIIKDKSEKKKKKESQLSYEIHRKSKHIDDLVTKIQNLYHKSEYYKEDLFKYQDEYSKTKNLLDIERLHKEKIQQNHEESNKNLLELRNSFQMLNEEIENYKTEKDQKIMEILNNEKEKTNKEIDRVRESYRKEHEDLIRNQLEKVQNIEKNNLAVLVNVKEYTAKRIESISKFYEDRISALINEIGVEEAKHKTELQKVVRVLKKVEKDKEELEKINEFLTEKTSENKAELAMYEKFVKGISDEKGEKLLENNIALQRNIIEMENLKKTCDESKKIMAAEYEKMIRINIKHKNEEIERLNERYQDAIQKLHKIQDEKEIKNTQAFELQVEHLLSKVEQLEKAKSTLEITLKNRENTLKNDIKAVKS